MAKAKKEPVNVAINGKRQGKTIGNAFDAKATADASKKYYDTSRAGAISVMLQKVFGHWTKMGKPHVGQYDFHLPPEGDEDPRTVSGNVQNRQSSKSFSPQRAKEIIAELQTGLKEGQKLKASDVLDVHVTHQIHPQVMARPSIKKRILEVLQGMEQQLRDEGTLPPELSLVAETKSLVIAEHAMDRLLVLHGNIGEALELLDNPVTINFVSPKNDD